MRPDVHNTAEQGFSLTEVVMALLVISLGLAGVMQVARMSAQSQVRVAEAATTRRNEAQIIKSLEATVRPLEPISLSKLTATPEGFDYDCQTAPSCRYDVPDGYSLRYSLMGTLHDRWPQAPVAGDPINNLDTQRLSALIVLDKTGKVIAAVELRVDHPPECQFDMVSRTCRRVDTPTGSGDLGEAAE